jgi:ligand-binding sensor domain-containing protein
LLQTLLVYQMVVDSSGFKWTVVKGSPSGMLVYDEGKNIDDLSDDRLTFLDNSTFPKELQNAGVNCLAVDLDGRIWVGTSSGVATFDCGNDPFRNTCQGRLIVSSLGGIGEYLLKDKNINAIAIDGANRKWFGTSTGIFVQSSDGRTEVAKFNTDNSPLLSNNITAIGIRQSTGEVFIGTDKGLMSYRTDAITGGTFNRDTVFAYPNPVRPDYTGPIAIKGLARDAQVKITDVNGSIVYETLALGGQAIWNGQDLSGRRVATGVYLVMIANTRNPELDNSIATKILFIN